MKKLNLFLVSMALSCSFVYAQQETLRIDSLVAAYVDEADFTGSILVAKGGKILLKKGYSFSNKETATANEPATVFNIASLTKTFTAALILKLQEQGKLSVNDKLSKFYPGYPNGDKITVHHLLTHTSGIANYTDDNNFRLLDQTKEVSLEKMIAFFKDKSLDFEPGTKFRYSNSGYTMLGYIIEKLTGGSYALALDRYIFKPLGMQRSSFGPPTESRNNAKGYGMYYKNFTYPTLTVHPSISYATGAIYSTVEDLYKWHRALQQGTLLSKKSIEVIYRKDKGPYGYGWFTDSLYGRQRVSHDGSIYGYKANINRMPEDDVCVVALSNSNNSSVGRMVRDIINILYGQPLSKPFSAQPVIAMSDSVKKSFTGAYTFNPADSMRIRVQLKDSNLVVTVGNQPPFEIEPVSKNQFKKGMTRIEFIMNPEGKAEQVYIYQRGEIMGGKKVE